MKETTQTSCDNFQVHQGGTLSGWGIGIPAEQVVYAVGTVAFALSLQGGNALTWQDAQPHWQAGRARHRPARRTARQPTMRESPTRE